MKRMADQKPFTRREALIWIVGIGVMLALIYAPLLMWLGYVGAHVQQLSAGGLLVLFAILICVRDVRDGLQFEPRVNPDGLWLLAGAFATLAVARLRPHWSLPLILVSFALAFAAVVSFLFGKLGVHRFLPALGAIVVFGLLAGLFPTLDWPLRAIAGKYAASLLAALGVPVRLAIRIGAAPELLLQTPGGTFIVATECNGAGLLTSSLIVAVVLALHERLRWTETLGLLVLAVPVAIVGNFLRIVSICLIAPRVPLPYYFVHEVLGDIFYLTGLALIWALAGRPQFDRPIKPPRPSPAPA